MNLIGHDRIDQQLIAAKSFQDSDPNVFPQYTITAAPNSYDLILFVPGFSADEMSVVVKDGVLTVTGDHTSWKNNIDKSGSKVVFSNVLWPDKFSKSFSLIDSLEMGAIAARDGMLIVKFKVRKSDHRDGEYDLKDGSLKKQQQASHSDIIANAPSLLKEMNDDKESGNKSLVIVGPSGVLAMPASEKSLVGPATIELTTKPNV